MTNTKKFLGILCNRDEQLTNEEQIIVRCERLKKDMEFFINELDKTQNENDINCYIQTIGIMSTRVRFIERRLGYTV